MSFEWYVARRYLTARRRQAFVSLISLVSIVGVCVGVMALVIALALMTGVQSELRDRIVGSTAHIYVYRIGQGFEDLDGTMAKLTATPGVTGAAPAILGGALMTASGSETSFVWLKGIDPAREPQVTDIANAMRSGSLAALTNRPEGARQGVVLGADLAKTLHVTTGDVVNVLTPEVTLLPLMSPIPRSRPLEVVGTFRFGFWEYDSGYALLSLPAAQSLLNRPDGPELIQLKLAQMDRAPDVREALQERLGANYLVQDWTELNKPLYSALWLEKVAISLTIGLIVMVAALNIVASLVLLVMEKSRDIAILRTMGASSAAVRRIFVYQGLTIGLVGTGVGTVLGLAACALLEHYQLIKLSGEVYQITYLPFRVLPLDVTIVVVSAVVVCWVATIYPARQAGKLDPAEALRHE
jgi:lipoprotein-releasing system permease protein